MRRSTRFARLLLACLLVSSSAFGSVLAYSSKVEQFQGERRFISVIEGELVCTRARPESREFQVKFRGFSGHRLENSQAIPLRTPQSWDAVNSCTVTISLDRDHFEFDFGGVVLTTDRLADDAVFQRKGDDEEASKRAKVVETVRELLHDIAIVRDAPDDGILSLPYRKRLSGITSSCLSSKMYLVLDGAAQKTWVAKEIFEIENSYVVVDATMAAPKAGEIISGQTTTVFKSFRQARPDENAEILHKKVINVSAVAGK